MTTIHNIPSSKLIYYRTFQDESPYSQNEIDRELLRRKYISFENNLEDFPEPKLIPRSFIRIQDEELKIEARGKGLENYCFDTEQNLFFTLYRLLKNSYGFTLKDGELPTYLILNSNLTWSERVLLNYISKRMQKVLIDRLNTLNKDLTNSLDCIVEGPSILLEAKNPTLVRTEQQILNEKLLLTFFKNYIIEFKKSVCIDDIGKFIPEDPFLVEAIMCGHPLRTIRERLIPSKDIITIWDSLLVSSAIKQEEAIITSNESDILTPSIEMLTDTDEEITEKIKRYCIEPLNSPKK